MNEMLERMARAAYEQWSIGVEVLEPSWDQCTEDFKFRMIEAQKAAFKEAREPTDAMLEAGRYVSDCDFNIGKSAALDCWQAMIDVIIRDQ